MSDPILHAETLEIEGAARDDYHEWMAEMAGVAIESNAEYIYEKGLDFEMEDIPF